MWLYSIGRITVLALDLLLSLNKQRKPSCICLFVFMRVKRAGKQWRGLAINPLEAIGESISKCLLERTGIAELNATKECGFQRRYLTQWGLCSIHHTTHPPCKAHDQGTARPTWLRLKNGVVFYNRPRGVWGDAFLGGLSL